MEVCLPWGADVHSKRWLQTGGTSRAGGTGTHTVGSVLGRHCLGQLAAWQAASLATHHTTVSEVEPSSVCEKTRSDGFHIILEIMKVLWSCHQTGGPCGSPPRPCETQTGVQKRAESPQSDGHPKRSILYGRPSSVSSHPDAETLLATGCHDNRVFDRVFKDQECNLILYALKNCSLVSNSDFEGPFL